MILKKNLFFSSSVSPVSLFFYREKFVSFFSNKHLLLLLFLKMFPETFFSISSFLSFFLFHVNIDNFYFDFFSVVIIIINWNGKSNHQIWTEKKKHYQCWWWWWQWQGAQLERFINDDDDDEKDRKLFQQQQQRKNLTTKENSRIFYFWMFEEWTENFDKNFSTFYLNNNIFHPHQWMMTTIIWFKVQTKKLEERKKNKIIDLTIVREWRECRKNSFSTIDNQMMKFFLFGSNLVWFFIHLKVHWFFEKKKKKSWIFFIQFMKTMHRTHDLIKGRKEGNNDCV